MAVRIDVNIASVRKACKEAGTTIKSVARDPYLLGKWAEIAVQTMKDYVPYDPTDDGEPHLRDGYHFTYHAGKETIHYSAYSMTNDPDSKWNGYNYAPIQHNNLAYNHDTPQQAYWERVIDVGGVARERYVREISEEFKKEVKKRAK